jgi:hypothetical protein
MRYRAVDLSSAFILGVIASHRDSGIQPRFAPRLAKNFRTRFFLLFDREQRRKSLVPREAGSNGRK